MKFLDAPITGAVAPRPVNVDGESTFRILEAYKVWLHREHEELSRDLYPNLDEPEGHFSPNTLAENFHYEPPGEPAPPRPHTRARLVLEAVGAIASRRIPADPDPVFSAIGAHRSALDRYEAAVRDNSRLREMLAGGRIRPPMSGREEKIGDTNLPEWIASERLMAKMGAAAREQAMDILATPPTTLAGAIELLGYIGEVEARRRHLPEEFREFGVGPDPSRAGQTRDWALQAQSMIADALYAMADARNCPEGFTPVMADGELSFISNRAFADLTVSRRAEIAVINPETCFDRPAGEPGRRGVSEAA
jgi:hypothetical protein